MLPLRCVMTHKLHLIYHYVTCSHEFALLYGQLLKVKGPKMMISCLTVLLKDDRKENGKKGTLDVIIHFLLRCVIAILRMGAYPWVGPSVRPSI